MNRGLLAIIVSMVSWGIGNPFSDYAVAELSAYQVFVLEILAGTAILLLIVLAIPGMRGSLRTIPWRLAIPFGLVQPGFAYLSGNIGYQYGSVTTGVILMASEVLFLAVGGAVFLKEHLDRRALAAIVVGFSGSVLVGLAGATSNVETVATTVRVLGADAPAGLIGAIAFLGTGLSGAVYGLWCRKYAVQTNVLSLTIGQLLSACAMALVVMVTMGSTLAIHTLATSAVLAAIAAGLFGIGIPFLLFNYGAQFVTTKQMAISLNIIPIVAIGFGAMLGRGLPAPAQYVGIVMVLVSLFALETAEVESTQSTSVA
jgi:drug/metabolite transporter (DMT)-like permease